MHRSGSALCAALLACTAVAQQRAYPPTGAQWTRIGSNPILVADQQWEGLAEGHPCVCEPDLMWIDSETLGKPGHWRMYYRGGWSTGAIGMATSPDGRVWSKRKGPVYGLNGSGFAGSAMQPWVLRVTPLDFTHAANVTSDNGGGSSNSNPRYPSWWLFTSSWQGSSRMNIATSENGVDWTTNASARVPLPEGKSLFGNRAVWTDSTTKSERHLADGSGSLEWTMLQEVGPAPWEIYVYTSRDGFDWVLGNSGGKPLRDLQRHSGGMYGGPSLANVDGKTSPKDTNGTYHLWYHASSASGDLPTDIYHASSEDLINWVVSPAGPVLLHGGAGTFEYDQVADPSPVVAGEHVMLFYDGDNNVNGSAAIGGAVFDRHRAATVLGTWTIVAHSAKNQFTYIPTFNCMVNPWPKLALLDQ